MRIRQAVFLLATALLFVTPADAFFEDLCLPRRQADGTLSWCLQPKCPAGSNPNRACPQQVADAATVQPGRSMIHHDATYFIAQALGYRPDVAYWIAAYNEVTDYGDYAPIDQCGVQDSASNSGGQYITASYNGFRRTNTSTDGPLDHYVVNFSPNGEGTDVHGAMGVQSLYPLYYPRPGYPVRIDDTYQKTLANFRQWAMLPTDDPGLLCTVGLTAGQQCLSGRIQGSVPLLMRTSQPAVATLDIPAGRKVLNWNSDTDFDYYTELGAYLKNSNGRLWMDREPRPVPVQLARIGMYLHVLQDTSSHATYCGDDAPSPPGGTDAGTYMYLKSTDPNLVQLSFGDSCANSPHIAGHVQETGTGDKPLPLRVYVALNNTVDELIAFGNTVAKQHGWIAHPQLLPPDLERANGQGQNAAQLKATLVGTIVKGTAYSRAEVYKSGVVSLPLQQENSLHRLHAMNAALARYGETIKVKMTQLPGNSANPKDTTVCWSALN